MNVDGTLLGEQITKRYPSRGDLQLVRLGAAAQFTCARCTEPKTARLVAIRGDALLCNGCYGRMAAEPPTAATAEEPTEVLAEEPDRGSPQSVVVTERSVEWTFHVRAEHLWQRACPVPAEVADLAPRTPFSVLFTQSGRFARILGEHPGVELRRAGGEAFLADLKWQPFALPGIQVSARWDRWKKIRFAYTPLDEPVVVAGTVVRHAHDPSVMIHDLADLTARADRVEELVLITLRELGYLDEQGRAHLPYEALARNTVERNPGERIPPKRIRPAVKRLVAHGVLTREQGSLGAGGALHHPARQGETLVQLLCYDPAPRAADNADPSASDGHSTPITSAHRVAGHLMHIGHLGKTASTEAKIAYRDDHRRAGLAGAHELPQGYTYVREHERGT